MSTAGPALSSVLTRTPGALDSLHASQWQSTELQAAETGAAADDARKNVRWRSSGSRWRDYLHFCGPGWFVAIAYVDPGNYQADIQSGSVSGYSQLWTVWWCTMLSWYVQVVCARLAVRAQTTLSEVTAANLPTPMRYLSYVIAEFSVTITDLPEVIGYGVAFNIFFGWPYYAGVLLSSVTTMIFLAAQYRGFRLLEAFIVLLIGVMSVALFVELGLIGTDGSALISGWVYGFAQPGGFDVFALIGIVGAVVMPHNLYLHTASVLSRPVERTETTIKQACFWSAIEPGLPIIVSFFVNMAIVAIAAETVAGLPNVGITDFSDYMLVPGARQMWALALLAAGQSSAITTTFTGQYIMEGFLTIRLPTWQRAVLTRLVALIPCVILASVAPNGQFLNIAVNIVNAALSILLPFALTPLIKYYTSRDFMGDAAPGRLETTILWIAAFLVYAVNAYALSAPGGGFFGDTIQGQNATGTAMLPNGDAAVVTVPNQQTPNSVLSNILMVLFQLFYLIWNIYIVQSPILTPMRPMEEARPLTDDIPIVKLFKKDRHTSNEEQPSVQTSKDASEIASVANEA